MNTRRSYADQPQRAGELRQNQLLHTFGIGSVIDLPNLSVMVKGLDHWDRAKTTILTEERLLAAVRAKLGSQVDTLRLPPYEPETPDVFAEWARVGVPVGLFPRWLRCSSIKCNRLAPADSGLFELLTNPFAPDRIRYVHGCRGQGNRRPTAVPARFVLACEHGHLDDFPWQFYVHKAAPFEAGDSHVLTLSESGTTGEAANVMIHCSCGARRSMADAFGEAGAKNLPACRGRHPHLGSFGGCGDQTRTMALGATNSWFPMQLRVFSLPKAEEPVAQEVAEAWGQLELLSTMPAATAQSLLRSFACWPQLEPYGFDAVWKAIQDHAQGQTDDEDDVDDLDLRRPEWRAFTERADSDLPDFTTRRERVHPLDRPWLAEVKAVPRLREVAALYGFTRIDAPEWDVLQTDDDRRGPLSAEATTWVPCAETRGEGIFLRFDQQRLAEWAARPAVRQRETMLREAHVAWHYQRKLPPGEWLGMRYLLLHTLAHALIREFALECGYSASGIAERIYARESGEDMAGVLLYTAAPDSEGTLGGLVALADRDRLHGLIRQALDAARLCSSDPLCAVHDPRDHARLYGASCHSCLFAAETSCERGNHYLDRALLVDTVADLPDDLGFFAPTP